MSDLQKNSVAAAVVLPPEKNIWNTSNNRVIGRVLHKNRNGMSDHNKLFGSNRIRVYKATIITLQAADRKKS